jgi:hypothetical protein
MDQRGDSLIFSCDGCGAVSIAVDAPLTDTSLVKCCGCGADLGPWGYFLDDLHWTLAELGVAPVRRPRPSPPRIRTDPPRR